MNLRRFCVLLLLVLGGASATPARQTSGRPADHVIIVMMDGTRPDVLRRVKAPTIQGLQADGATFLQARTIYPSQTRVAFVSLPTGAYPGSHGIVGGNNYKDAAWKTISLGDDGDPFPSQVLCERPTMFEDATAAGLTSLYAGMKGYELVGARGATWTINGNLTIDRVAYPTRYDQEVLGSPALAAHYKQRLSRDLLDQALLIVREKRPNLAIINLASADYVAHTLGPESAYYSETLEFIDGLIADLLKTLTAAGIRDRTTIVVSADHGFSQLDHRFVIAPLADPRVKVLTDLGIEHFVTNTGGASAGLYLRDKRRIGEAVAALRKEPWCEALYCERAVATCDRTLTELHAYYPGRSPDIMVDLDDDASLNRPWPGNHGSLRDTDMHIPLIFSGAGVVRGVVLGKAVLVDVAPTVLRLLGVTPRLLRPDGRVLDEVFVRTAASP